ncbi:Rad17-domain-containing protein [Trametes gibbosa]|nr:Rad17-domain-containing protein [Trametes gibbosa]
MPPKRASKSSRTATRLNTQPLYLTSSSPNEPPPAKKIKTKSLISIARPPIFDLEPSQLSTQLHSSKLEGKQKQLAGAVLAEDAEYDSLWVDKYEPANEEGLAVHKKKVQDVKQWLLEALDGGPSGKLKKYRRILVLTGPAGTAKTAAIRVLARSLGYEITEWRNSVDEHFSVARNSNPGGWGAVEYQGLSEKFQAFLTRASNCRPLFHSQPSPQPSSQASRSSHKPSSSSSNSLLPKRQLILLEDLPNVLHSATQASFHCALENFASSPEAGAAPLVIIISDAGVRGMNPEDDGQRFKPRTKEAMDVRNVLSPNLLHSPYVTLISFNPVAATYMRNALKTLLDRHFASPSAPGVRPSKDVLDVIIESSNGDIRSAVMALQFACTADGSARKLAKGVKKGTKSHGPSARMMLEAVTRREQSLALFHLLGKIMYNKRKGDPSASSASAKDVRKDQEIDARLKEPPSLPPHFKHHERRASRVDVEALYADAPIDASLLSLYIHQNYPQYCTTLDECGALMDTLSWADASGGETWYQTNPHHFHLVALGTLHALPSPVPRRNQKSFKPAFFDAIRRTSEVEDGVRDVQMWLQQNSALALPGWSQRDVALHTGTTLRALDRAAGTSSFCAPPTHRLFSTLEFSKDEMNALEFTEEGELAPDPEPGPQHEREERASAFKGPRKGDDEATGVWLSDDDIEEW